MPWSNAAQQNYTLLLKNGFETNVPGVQSETQEDIEGFLPEVYRDEMDATFTGATRNTLVESASTDSLIPNGSITNVTGVSDLTYAAVQDPILEESDSFTHTAPRPTPYTRTRFLWWSGASGSGNVVAWAWEDRIEAFSPSEFTQL